ncbi:MAG: ABA4-like family protein [Cyanobacteriota bacterium]
MLEMIFTGANWFALPFWALMILLPGWKVTRKVMESLLPIAVLAAVYLYLLVTGLDGTSLQSFSELQLSLTDLTQLFAQPKVMAAGWVHYIVMDLFVGRWIYLEGRNKQIWTSHSLLLCLFAGPVGLLSHLFTAAVVQTIRQGQSNTAKPEILRDVPNDVPNPDISNTDVPSADNLEAMKKSV